MICARACPLPKTIIRKVPKHWTQRNVFCKVLERVIEFFGAAITKKTAFFAQEWQKKAIFLPKTVFLGPGWSVVGLPTLF